MTADRSLLVVHAHPDDEVISTGVTMAKYVEAGVHVTLVTCTLGELGEVVVDDLKHLGSWADDRLGAHRIDELAASMKVLGVDDHRFLGAPGRYRDSGMMDEPTNDLPGSFWSTPVETAAADLVEVMREMQPQVVVTYDDNGAYGHPDHIQAHRVTAAAFASVQSEPWAPRKLYWTAIPKSRLQAMMDFAKQAGLPEFFEGAETVDDLPLGTPDELVTTEIDGTAYVDRKMAAMRAHRSQIADDSPFFSFPPEMLPMVWGYEHFTLAEGPRGPGAGEEGWEPDLFAGL